MQDIFIVIDTKPDLIGRWRSKRFRLFELLLALRPQDSSVLQFLRVGNRASAKLKRSPFVNCWILQREWVWKVMLITQTLPSCTPPNMFWYLL